MITKFPDISVNNFQVVSGTAAPSGTCGGIITENHALYLRKGGTVTTMIYVTVNKGTAWTALPADGNDFGVAGLLTDLIVNSTASAGLDITADASSTWQLSGNAVGNLLLAIDSVNAGAGEGRLSLSADDQINLNDGTCDLQFDAGIVTETGMVSLNITPSGAVTVRGGGASQFGDDTGYLAFDGAGAASTSGVTTLSLTPSGVFTLTASDIDLDPTGTVDLAMDATKTITLHVADDLAGAFLVQEGANNYLEIDTANAGASVKLGNAATNPVLTQVGNGQVTFPGNVDAQNGLDVSVAALTMTGTNIDLDPTGTFDLAMDAGQAFSIDIDGAVSNISLATSGDAQDLTIEVTGATNSSLILQSTGTGTDALRLNASAGGVDIDAAAGLSARGATSAEFGDDTALLSFDGAGAVSTSGVTTVDLDASGAVQINSSGGAVSIANDNVAQDANFATAGARTVNIGAAATVVTNIEGGVGDVNLISDTQIDIDAPTVDLSTQAIDFELKDNEGAAATFSQGAVDYIGFCTSDNVERTFVEVPFEAQKGMRRFAYHEMLQDFEAASGATLPTPWAAAESTVNSTIDYVADAAAGIYQLAHSADAEAQAMHLDWGDQLMINLSKGPIVRFRARVNLAGATLSADQRIVLGVASDYAADLDTVTTNAWFRMEGANLDILIEKDDGVDVDDTDTGTDYVDNTWYWFEIDFTTLATTAFRVYDATGAVLLDSDTLDMSGVGANTMVQPIVAIQKDGGADTDLIEIDCIQVVQAR